MRKDFVSEVARVQHVKRTDLIEKDLILHQVLFDLSKTPLFRENFAFKGGTCLAKCYLYPDFLYPSPAKTKFAQASI
jgi:predicted nucleotidyltransferase component of viral defense system